MKQALSVLLLLALTSAVFAADAPERRTLTVSGTAEVNAQPDICYMGFVVETHNKSASQAYRDNNAQMSGINAAVKAQGVEAKDLQTVRFSITPEYHYEKNSSKRIFDGYRVTNTLHVSVRNLTKVSDILDAAMNAGAAEISQVTFSVENPKKYTADARVEAIKAAKAKAELIAAEVGVKLKKPTTVYESEPGSYGALYAQSNVMMERTAGGGAGDQLAELEPGEMKISHTVHITYEIE